MHTSATLILRRVDRLVSERLQPAVIADRRPLELTAWEAPGEPVPLTEAAERHDGSGDDAALGGGAGSD